MADALDGRFVQDRKAQAATAPGTYAGGPGTAVSVTSGAGAPSSARTGRSRRGRRRTFERRRSGAVEKTVLLGPPREAARPERQMVLTGQQVVGQFGDERDGQQAVPDRPAQQP